MGSIWVSEAEGPPSQHNEGKKEILGTCWWKNAVASQGESDKK